jgi:8-oxo-dGTP pyrophosphatase MutT (NUDIX family)
MSQYTIYLKNSDQLYNLIHDKLKNHLPKEHKYADVPYKKAAVIIPLFFKDEEAHLLFTKRTDKVEHHKGQISFPGGSHESTDAHLQETAIRETWEEMGIEKDDLTIIGRTDKFLTNTHFLVTPYVAHFNYPYPYRINPDEIEQVIEVPLRHLIDAENFEINQWEKDGIVWDIHYYNFFGEIIWGVTGFLLSNFLSIVFGLPHLKNTF